ncbi:MAG: carbamoyltransferase [Candidatus Peribacteraceae bacterium]|nr:carbamoyltransferase [Candidatus Peribacteraceae bacterium]MDD5740022.1 carbamoyltransferase [Candidatus Peribacteraceae bacterium]
MPKPVFILGISCYYHDSAAVLLKDGIVIFAAQEERYTRKKHDENFPKSAIAAALQCAGITAQDLSAVVFYEKPLLKFFDRIITCVIAVWPRGFWTFHRAMHEWLNKKLWIPQLIRKELKYTGPLFFTRHHEAHAASAYYPSGFPDATIVTVDGVGEWATTTIGYGKGTDITLRQEIRYPHSLGLLYSALTYYLGFKVNSAEYKVMGLAPYGEPKHMKQMRELIDLKEDGSFALNRKYFTYEYGQTMTGKAFERLFGQPTRTQESPLTQFHKDTARSLQELTNEVMLKIVRHAKQVCPSDRLCLAGGVALNCVANGLILRSRIFKEIFIQPAAGDAGGALGAALYVWHRHFKGTRSPKMEHVFLGTEYGDSEISALLRRKGLPFEKLDDGQLIERTATLLEGENVIGWFQGRMEFGPRALGNRSIIADARNAENWKKVNLKIKFRESFRPFAPTVLVERVSEYFTLDRESPYMLLVADTQPEKRLEIPAVTHVDGSARIQTISRTQNARYYDLIDAFAKRTGCPVIINTSFNVRGEPIVESPEDAVNCFLNTHMDYLVLGNHILSKLSMPAALLKEREEYLRKFELD